MRILLMLIACHLSPATAAAQEDRGDSTSVQTVSDREFTEENPLVYEDAWDLWPYAFLNEKGEPVGFNIDLLSIIFKELNIPYVIKLKPTVEALNDLKAGKADLMLGMDAHFHDDYARYGQSVIQLFTHSVVYQKGQEPLIQSLEDLGRHRVIVHGGSFSHHLMIKRGWEDNAIPYDDMQEAVQKAHLDPDAQIVWNTLSLKWLIQKLQFNNLELTSVDIQHGEYKFMSNNPRLLHQLDSVYTILRSEDRLQPIQNKWFYPERQPNAIPRWVWNVAGALVAVILAALIYYAIYRMREKKMTKAIRKSNNRLSLILNTSKVRIWSYNVAARTITLFDDKGTAKKVMPASDFLENTTPGDFKRLQDALRAIAKQEQESITLDIMAKDTEAQGELRHFTTNLSVLRRDRSGRPIEIIGTRSDVTEETLKQQKVKDMMLRYQAVSNSAMIDMVMYDANGIIIEMNKKAWAAFPEGREAVLQEKISVSDVMGMDIDLDTMEPIYVTQIYKDPDDGRALSRHLRRSEMYYELKLMPVRDDKGKLLAIFGTGRDVTEVAKSYSNLQKDILLLQDANLEMGKYISNIDYVLKNGNVRIVNYSPDTHTLKIFSEIDVVQYELTQTRAIELTDESHKRHAQRLLNSMDNLTTTPIETFVKTTLRVRGRRLYLQLSFVPALDANGRVTSYFGMCRDVSEIKETEAELEKETVRAQEVETVKNAFLRNMSYEIRTPLNTVVGFAELFEMEHSPEDEAVFISEIKQSSSSLLKLINDILFLSRLDARMIEFKPKETDFATIFETRCQTAWFNHQNPDVQYTAVSPYNSLIVEIDDQNVGIIIDQIVANAVEHTTKGQVRTRYDYTGEALVMAFQDTGSGIPEEMLSHIFDRFMSTDGHGTGLGLSICRELATQMGGKINIKSEVGEGTIVWVTIPCRLIKFERK